MSADAVSLKLPSLWTNDVETWFAQAEAQFALRDITNETTKFHHVVSVLSADVASKVSSILRSPPGHNPYTALKKQLTCKYQLTEHERAAAIFNIPALGDKRPSQIMDRMLHLLGGCEGGILFRYHFISILPIYVKNTLALSTTDIPKTAITTPFDLWEFLRMPFGLWNAGQTFQQMIDHVLLDLPFVFTYLDDILVASSSPENHMHHLKEVFKRLSENSQIISLEKCVFGADQVDFLGHHISQQGCSPRKAKMDAIQSFPPPTDSKQLQQFLGMINFYRKFLPNGAALLKPLYEAVKGTHKKTQLNWTSDMQTAFNAAKCSLSASATLAHPLPNSTIALTTDASDIGIGACLEQHTERGWQPISFFSKKLKKSEQKYSTFDRELLALYEAVRHFRYFLEGQNFIMFTDHQPLVKSLHKQSDPWSTRQQRHLSYVSEHSTDIRHIAGKHNIIADYLSRSPISDTCNQVSMGLDLQALAAAQSTCQDTQSYRTAITGMTVADVPVHEGGPSLLCDTS